MTDTLKPLRWGMLGAAKIGMTKVLPAMMKSPLCQVTAIASRDGNKARAAADSLGIEKSYGSYEDMLADPDIDAIYNPLPNTQHVPWSIKAADAGKHVLCEKPLALNAEEAHDLIKARDRNKVHVAEAFMIRHHPQWHQARQWIRDGRIGDLRSIVAFFSYFNRDADNIRNQPDQGGGAMFDIGVYPIVSARYLFGEEPGQLVSTMEKDPVFGTDRLSSAILEFPSGQAIFTCSTQLAPYQRLQAIGTEGRIEIQIPYNAPADTPCKIFLDTDSALGDASAQATEIGACDQYRLQAEQFCRVVRGAATEEFPLEDSVKMMCILDCLFDSAEQKRWLETGL